MLKKLLNLCTAVLCLFLMYSHSAAQTTHHVYSTEIPWKSGEVSKENGKVYSINDAIGDASAGDVIVVHEGIYREKVTVTKNNITIQNYTNDYVLVTGAEVVTGWTKASGMASGVMQADISSFSIQTPYTQLFADGNAGMMARHPNNTTGKMMEPLDPNSGYALLGEVSKASSGDGKAVFSETTLPSVDLKGGIFRGLTGKMRNYIYGTITGNSGNTVNFKAINNNNDWSKSGAISKDRHKFSWGFVMHKNLTDAPNEWFVDGNKLYYMPEAGEDVNNMRIEIQVRERVLVLNNTSGVIIEGINFVAGNVDMQKTLNAIIDRSSFRYLYPFFTPNGYGQNVTEKTGIYLTNSSDNTFKNTYMAHTWGNMVAMKDGKNNSFENCVLNDMGWVGVFTSSIYIVKADNTKISKCTFGEAGRFQIRVSGGHAKVDILDSEFYGAMKMGEDAGPIEATSTGWIGALDMKGSEIAYNKVHDVLGIPVCDNGYMKQKVTAFYMEDTQNYTAHHNLIYNLKQNNYNGPHNITRDGSFLYLGPRYNPMDKKVQYYNNTVWNYDHTIGIWDIEIANWESLGLNHDGGRMTDGSFINNVFESGAGFGLTYTKKQMSASGQMGNNVGVSNPPHIETTDFNKYVEHCKGQNYHFNPQTNFILTGNANFVDASNGDFTLAASSKAKGGGTEINGITSSANPDAGALEGSNRVLFAGAAYTPPAFLETGETTVVPTEMIAFNNFPAEFPTEMKEFVFNVTYTALEQRDIAVVIKTPEGTFIAQTTATVATGSGTKEITVTIESSLTEAKSYIFTTALREVGGDYTTNIKTENKNADIKKPEVVLPTEINFVNIPKEIVQSLTIPITVEYSTNDAGDVLIVLTDSDGNRLGNKRITVEKGTAIETLTIALTDLPAVADGYIVKCQIRKVGGTASDILTQNNELVNIISASINPPIKLTKGWNLIGCPLEGSTEIEIALASILDKIEIVKCFDEFYDAKDPTLSSLQYVKWGEGYFVKVSEDCELIWK